MAGILSADDASFVPLRGRLLFPIMDQEERVIAFSGRSVDGVRHSFNGKYVNSPTSPTYDKSKALYGSHYVTESTERVVLMEGNLDIIGANEVYGDDRIVALAACGTAFTQHHLKWIMSQCSKDVEVILVTDGDAAGHKAVIKSMWIANVTRNSSCVRLPDGEDPWDIYLQEPDKLEEMLDESRSLVQSVVDAQWATSSEDPISLEEWVRDTYHTLSFTEDKNDLLGMAARKVGKTADRYRKDISLTVSLDSHRSRKRGNITNINPISAPMKVIIGALLKMDQDERDGVMAPLSDWDEESAAIVERWLPVQNQMDVDAMRHLALGLDAPHRPDIEREIVGIISEDREYDLSNALKAMSRQFLSCIRGSASPFMQSQIRCLQRLSSVCGYPSEQSTALAWFISLGMDFQMELENADLYEESASLAN